jgi:hypothetical protein
MVLKINQIFAWMNILKLSIAILGCFLLTSGTHPFFVSITEIEFHPKSKEIGIALKTFPDDLEETIRGFSGKKLDLSKKNNPENNQLIAAYLKKHLAIDVNQTRKEMQFLGYEIDKEAIWVYFNIPKINSIKSLKVHTDVMYEYKTEQTNIVHVSMYGKSSSHKLNAPNSEIEIRN